MQEQRKGLSAQTIRAGKKFFLLVNEILKGMPPSQIQHEIIQLYKLATIFMADPADISSASQLSPINQLNSLMGIDLSPSSSNGVPCVDLPISVNEQDIKKTSKRVNEDLERFKKLRIQCQKLTEEMRKDRIRFESQKVISKASRTNDLQVRNAQGHLAQIPPSTSSNVMSGFGDVKLRSHLPYTQEGPIQHSYVQKDYYTSSNNRPSYDYRRNEKPLIGESGVKPYKPYRPYK